MAKVLGMLVAAIAVKIIVDGLIALIPLSSNLFRNKELNFNHLVYWVLCSPADTRTKFFNTGIQPFAEKIQIVPELGIPYIKA